MRLLTLFVLGGIALMSPATSSFSSSDRVRESLQIKTLMKASEFEQCGLSRLSEAELGSLNAWLESYTIRVVEVTLGSRSKQSPDIIESHIDGEFEGWDGDTIFKLDNGQIWQQTSYDYTYHYARTTPKS